VVDLAAIIEEWRDVRLERRAVPSAASIPTCEYEAEGIAPEGPCYGHGHLYGGAKSCDPCRARLARFNRIKDIAARLRSVEARMMRAAVRGEGKETTNG